jgi:hypothetical protein
MFVLDKESDGRADRLGLKSEGENVLSGSTIELSYTASDSARRSCLLPDDIEAESEAALGSISGISYTALETGTDVLKLSSASTGASGTGRLHIIDAADSLMVRDSSGKTISKNLMLSRGEILPFFPEVRYLGRDVLSSLDAFTFDVEGDIGEIDESGIFTASLYSDRLGFITVSACGLEYRIEISIPASLRI